jgi:hypothetical protein
MLAGAEQVLSPSYCFSSKALGFSNEDTSQWVEVVLLLTTPFTRLVSATFFFGASR